MFAEIEQEKPKTVVYILSILAAAEAKKTVISKRISQSAIVRLDTDDPWDTMKAQILVKIDQALHPSRIQYDDYDIKFYITRVLPKPGLSLVSETDYEVMMLKARKLKGSDPEINITVTQTHSDGNKENEAAIEELDQDATKKKSVRDDILWHPERMQLMHPPSRPGRTLLPCPETSTRIGTFRICAMSTSAQRKIASALEPIALMDLMATISY